MTDEEIPALADAIYREKVLRARRAPAEKKMGWGAELFMEVLVRMRAGIRMQFPEADEEGVERILRARLKRLTRVHEHGIYSVAKIA